MSYDPPLEFLVRTHLLGLFNACGRHSEGDSGLDNSAASSSPFEGASITGKPKRDRHCLQLKAYCSALKHL